MEEPEHQDRRSEDEQAECLVAPEGAALFFTPVFFGELLLVRLDAGFNHACLPAGMRVHPASV